MSDVQPWLRKIKVTLGPLAEWQGSTNGEVLEWESDGSLNGLRVTGTFQKTIMGMPSPSQISIYNISLPLKDGIKQGLTKIKIECGYANTNMQLLFQGSVMCLESHRSGPDVVTKITAMPGYGAIVRGASSITFKAGTPLKEAVKKLASDLPGVSVDDGSFTNITGKIGSGGWSFSGSTRDGLTKLAEEYGFSWSINDNRLTAIEDKYVLPSFVELNGEDGGLIDVSPQVAGPMAIMTGIKAKAIYVPGVTAGQSVKITSKLNPRLNGVYRINTCSISIDAYSDAWTMDLDCRKGL